MGFHGPCEDRDRVLLQNGAVSAKHENSCSSALVLRELSGNEKVHGEHCFKTGYGETLAGSAALCHAALSAFKGALSDAVFWPCESSWWKQKAHNEEKQQAGKTWKAPQKQEGQLYNMRTVTLSFVLS